MVLAAIGAGHLINTLVPDVDTRERPFLESGQTDKNVETRRFDITLLGTRVAKVVEADGWKHDTQGKWVILRVRLVAKNKPVGVQYAAIHDTSDRTFLMTDRLEQPLIGARLLQPGIAVEGEVVFEVPKDANGLTARFAVQSGDSGVRRMDAMADIALPLPDTGIWLDPKPVTLVPVEVKP